MLCCGGTMREGWTRLDANPAKVPDILATIPPLPPEVTNQKWEEIELIHGITSFYPWDAEQLLREIHSVLEPGGKVVLEQPDLDRCWEARKKEWILGDPQFCDPLHVNRSAWTPRELSDLLTTTGFNRIEILPAQHHQPSRDFRVEAYR